MGWSMCYVGLAGREECSELQQSRAFTEFPSATVCAALESSVYAHPSLLALGLP